jgi:hypothetical protein
MFIPLAWCARSRRMAATLDRQLRGNGYDPTTPWLPQQAWDGRAPTVALKVGWLQPDDISPPPAFLASDATATVIGAVYDGTGGDRAKDGYRWS